MSYAFRDDLTRADLAFDASGSTREELFASAWRALLDAMLENGRVLEKRTTRDVELESGSLDLLLVAFLSEALFFKDAEGLFLSVEELAIAGEGGGFRLKAKLAGEPADRSRHELGTDVKAVTLHRFQFESDARGYKATVVIDV